MPLNNSIYKAIRINPPNTDKIKPIVPSFITEFPGPVGGNVGTGVGTGVDT